MSFLDTLEGITLDTTLRERDKLIQAIELQKRAATEGDDFTPDTKRFSRWFVKHDGAWYSHLKAGNTTLTIKGHTSFKGGATLDELVAWYDEVIATIRTGALDGEIEAATQSRKGRKRSPDAKPRKSKKLEVAA